MRRLHWILLLVVFMLAAACAHFPVHPGECPFVDQGGYGIQYVLDASDPECKIRCLQRLANACHLYGPTPQ